MGTPHTQSSSPSGEYQTLVERAAGLGLWPRQLDVVRLVAEGWSNKQIARRLGVTEQTVKNHVTAALRTTGCCTRLELAVFAFHHRLHNLAAVGQQVEGRRARLLAMNREIRAEESE